MDLEEACRHRGVRVNRYRSSILRMLAGTQRHASVDLLHQALRQEYPRMHLPTVYRAVRTLEEAGALVRLDFGDGITRYEAADQSHHDHLIDPLTGTVIEIHDERIATLIGLIVKGLGYRLTGYKLNVYGVPDAPNASTPAVEQPPIISRRRA